MPVRTRRWIRRLRGGSQAHLVEAEDGDCYVLKARNNPQHHRILPNEWVAAVCLRYLQLPCPETAVLALNESIPELTARRGEREVPIEPGWHFGSRYVSNPAQCEPWDFLPDKLLEKIVNGRDFLGMYLFDQWTSNADGRQAVFFRAQMRLPKSEEREPVIRPALVASFIDHGFCFQGPSWRYADAARQGLYHRRLVYERVTGWDDFEPWLSRIEHFPEEVLDRALREIPMPWFDGPSERDEFEALLERLLHRRTSIRRLAEAGRGINLFPKWQ
ncbi:MAG: HipA family kinase [Bryobacteraceae bacterium]